MPPFLTRCLLLVGLLLGLGARTFAQPAVASPESSRLSLTLIPPSPVTDRIDLDLRCAIGNPTEQPAWVEDSFYLDDENPDQLLYRASIFVEPHSAGGLAFRWPTDQMSVGRHRIILVAQRDGRTERTERPLEILATGTRSTGQIGGAWTGFYHWSEKEGRLWNANIRLMTDAQWAELTRAMHEAGMNTVVIQEVFRNQEYVGKHAIERDGYHGKAFYPSQLYPGRMEITAHDPVEAILAEADRLDMNVMLGVGHYAWFDFTPGSLRWHKAVARELWERYGHHRSFYGWYVSAEIFGNLGENDQRRQELVDFLAALHPYLQTLAPDKPLMLASNCYGIPQGDKYYPGLLANLDILCPFGFHRMPKGDQTGEQAALQLQRLSDTVGCHLWLDLEVFLFGKQGELIPRPLDGLARDLQRFPNFEKILCYQFPGLLNAPWMSRQPGGAATVKLYEDYRNFMKRATQSSSASQTRETPRTAQ